MAGPPQREAGGVDPGCRLCRQRIARPEAVGHLRLRGLSRAAALVAVLGGGALGVPQGRDLVLATTTSVRDAGLLDALLPGFERQSGRRVKVIAVGSGQALELGRRGEADLLIVHDPAGESAFVAQGFGRERVVLASNEFVLVGPPDDPARVRGLRSASAALAAIARAGARFVSRGDRSGTHVKELELWRLAGLAPRADRDPWYLEAGQGMGATLEIADQLGAYTLVDVATYCTQGARLGLAVLVEGDPLLGNPYHIILVNPLRFAWVDTAGARALRDYFTSPGVQAAIAAFGRRRCGRSVFLPAAER